MNIAVIVAGGSGTRMGDMKVPKQFADVCGRPLIVRTLEKFNSHREINGIVVGCREDYAGFLRELSEKEGIYKLKEIVPGGASRQETVFKCLSAINGAAGDIIVIHDAVRPLVTEDIISGNIRGAKEYGAVNTVIPAADTLAKSGNGFFIDEMPPRTGFYQVQTPQTFKYEIIMDAHLNAIKNGVTDSTDDCRLVMENGGRVYLAKGSRMNFKITTYEDLCLFTALTGAEKAGRNFCDNQ